MLKVVLVGAGSANFGRATLVDLFASAELRDRQLEIALVDIDPAALARMQRLAQLLKTHFKSTATISATTDRCQALPGASYVIVAVAVRRFALWEQDYRVPLAFGFKQVDGENGGPGGAFHTLRSLHAVVPIARDMERLCPQALLINFTNPESRVCLGVSKLTRTRVVGLCHGGFMTRAAVAELLERPVAEVDITIGGLNHFHWVLQCRSVPAGDDLLPDLYQALASKHDQLDPTVRRLYDLFGLYPFCSGGHIAEYLAWGHETRSLLWAQGEEGRPVGGDWGSYRRWTEGEADRVRRVADGELPLDQETVKPSGEIAVAIICDSEFDLGRRELAVNIPNTGLAIANLPADAIVEIPARVDADGIHGEPVGPLPETLAALCRIQLTIQNLLVEAYSQQSRQKLLQALVLDPVVNSVDRAEQMMAVMLTAERDFLPDLH